MVRTLCLALLAVLACGAIATVALADDAKGEGPHVRVELLAERTAVVPGRDLVLGVRFTTDPHWHVYWKHEGDSGLPPTVRLTLPAGATAGPIEWPTPKRFIVGPVAGFGYEGDVVLPIRVRVPTDLDLDAEVDADSVMPRFVVTAAVEWLVCEEECIPGGATLRLDLPYATEEPAADPRVATLFAAARDLQPRALPEGVTAGARAAPGHVDLVIRGTGPWTTPGAAFTWFPVTPLAFDHPADVTVRTEGDGLHLRLPLARGRTAPPRLDGVLDVRDGESRHGFTIDVKVEGEGAAVPGADATPPSAAVTPASPSPVPREVESLWLALLLAFAGGLILNVMPCVLPVISLKILSFVQQAGAHPEHVRRHGYAFGSGVLVSFWVLAGLLLGLRAAGEALGWGFQFQEPGFTGALCLLMFAVGLNLLGVFEIGMGLSGRAGDAEARGHAGYAGSFSSGVLATVIATPCTAPFMGVALGYALAAPVLHALLVFTALGAGMAAPYVVLSAYPGWLSRLPGAGRWMETFKQAMAFPMFAVVVGVGLVFGKQTGVEGLVFLLFALLLIGVAAWLWGRFGGLEAEGLKRAVAGRAMPALFAIGAVVAVVLGSGRTQEGEDAPPEGWLAWKPGIEAELRAQGRPVFVDYTADWCLTCLANDKAVLSTDTVRTAALLHDVAMVRADWTRKSSDIRDALALLGRASIPVYVVYPPDPAAPGEVLPTAITPSTIVDAFGRASGKTP